MYLLKKLLALGTLCVAALVFAAAASASGYEIRGTIEGDINGATEVVLADDARNTIATARIVDNGFVFVGNTDQPMPATITVGSRYYPLILENDRFEVLWADTGAVIRGGKHHNQVYGYLADPKYIAAQKKLAEVMALRAEIDSMDREAIESWQPLFGKAMSSSWDIVYDHNHSVLEGNYPTLVKFWVLKSNSYDRERYSMEKRLQLALEYQQALPGHEPVGKYIASLKSGMEAQKARARLAPGNPYLPVTAATVDGDQLPLGEVLKDNKVVLLEFWASWCGPCRAAFPHLKRAYEQYHDKGFEIYAISLDEDHDDWLQAMEEENVPWINLVDYAGFGAKSARDYAVWGIPASFLITGDGTLLGSNFRDWKLDDALKEHFGE